MGYFPRAAKLELDIEDRDGGRSDSRYSPSHRQIPWSDPREFFPHFPAKTRDRGIIQVCGYLPGAEPAQLFGVFHLLLDVSLVADINFDRSPYGRGKPQTTRVQQRFEILDDYLSTPQ